MENWNCFVIHWNGKIGKFGEYQGEEDLKTRLAYKLIMKEWKSMPQGFVSISKKDVVFHPCVYTTNPVTCVTEIKFGRGFIVTKGMMRKICKLAEVEP